MAKKKPKEGALIRIDLGDSTVAFARVLAQYQIALYDKRLHADLEHNLSEIYGSAILFKITVMRSALVSTQWKVIDHRPLESVLASPNEYYMKDALTGKFSIYRSTDGDIRPCAFEDCKNLEATAVWEAKNVEARLRDHFAGRPNETTERLRAKL